MVFDYSIADSLMTALATDNDNPEAAILPSTQTAMVSPEGAGVLILETLERAAKRGLHLR